MDSIKHSVYSIIKHSLIIKPVVLIDFVKKRNLCISHYIGYSTSVEIDFTYFVKCLESEICV